MKQMTLQNCTSYKINILKTDGTILEIPPCGTVPRLSVEKTKVAETMDGIPVYRTVFGKTTGLPDEIPGTGLIVSALVRLAMPERRDLFSPGELIRDENGNPVACDGLLTA